MMLTYPGDGLDLESRSYSDTISEQVVILMEVSRTLAATCIVAQKQGGGYSGVINKRATRGRISTGRHFRIINRRHQRTLCLKQGVLQ